MILLTSVHAFVASISTILIAGTLTAPEYLNICRHNSEVSLAFYLALNLLICYLSYINFVKASEMDTILLEKSRNILFMLALMAPVCFLGLFMHGFGCPVKQNFRTNIVTVSAEVFHLFFEGITLGIYFWVYLRNVLSQ